MNSKDPATPGRVMLTVIALVLSLLKVICSGRGQRGGDTLGLGDRGGPGEEGGTGSSQDRWPRSLSTPLEGLLPGGGTWSEKGCTPLFQIHLINLHTLEGRDACGPSSLLSGRGHPGAGR